MDAQALRTIQHNTATGTDLLSWAKGGGQQVLASLTIGEVVGASGGLPLSCGRF
jgi:hypothetical protein